jgi:TonB family protein
MFEQATLASGPAGKRVWTTFLGVATQVMLVGGAILVPMIWPQIMPRAQLLATFLPPVPPGPPPKGDLAKQRTAARVVPRAQFHGFVAPARIPTRVAWIDDAPAANYVIGVPNGDARGSEPGIVGAFFSGLPANAVHIEPPAVPVVAPPKPASPPEEPKRFRPGGRIQLGRLIRKVEPVYPALARTTRASGTVQLEGVVGTDGRVREVKVMSGSPLLARAAAEAVLQWVYEPSRLNGELIEIIASITVTFKLN